MQILSEKRGPMVRARILGELDHHTAASTRESLDKLLSEDVREMVLDLSGLTFMDSSGIGVLIGRYKVLAARGGKLKVAKPNTQIDKILRLSGLYSILDKA